MFQKCETIRSRYKILPEVCCLPGVRLVITSVFNGGLLFHRILLRSLLYSDTNKACTAETRRIINTFLSYRHLYVL
jgi:hypothetical protein